MTVLESLSPKPLPAYIPETEESRKFNYISEALSKAGIHGEENMIETCEILELKGCCDNEQSI